MSSEMRTKKLFQHLVKEIISVVIYILRNNYDLSFRTSVKN